MCFLLNCPLYPFYFHSWKYQRIVPLQHLARVLTYSILCRLWISFKKLISNNTQHVNVSRKSYKWQIHHYKYCLLDHALVTNTRIMCEICSKLTIKASERRQWRHYGVFLVNFEQILLITQVLVLLILNKKMQVGLTSMSQLTLQCGFPMTWLINYGYRRTVTISKHCLFNSLWEFFLFS